MLPTFHVGQAILTTYTALLSYTSIVKLNKYEELSEKAAGYSNTAEHQLHKTRTTMASGALATLCSLLSSAALIVISPETDRRQMLLISMVNTAATAFAYVHISNFWRVKAKIPMVTDFNDAINTSNAMRTSLLYLAMTWGIADVIYGYLNTAA